jgi:adenine-specific DNA-methyltransferase
VGLVQVSSAKMAVQRVRDGKRAVMYAGDCTELIAAIPDEFVDLTITSPPYCMGKSYESSCRNVDDFRRIHETLLPEIVRVTKPGGSICWQVGYHAQANSVMPLDYIVYGILSNIIGVRLRNRIVWTFGHGVHCSRRFSGRHEVILWFTKGDSFDFDLDSVRVPQKYPGKRHYKGPHKGEFSGNPLGKNPGDVWEIPNVKSRHVEKTSHPCQFPVALVQRVIRAVTKKKGLVFDPFSGVASTGLAAILDHRRFLGAETDNEYLSDASKRFAKLEEGLLPIRPLGRPVYVPNLSQTVAQRPPHFASNN